MKKKDHVRNRLPKGLPFLGLLLLFPLISACGGDHDDGRDGFGPLAPHMDALSARVDSHYAEVSGILSAAGSSLAAAALFEPADSLRAEIWTALDQEHFLYGEDMRRTMTDLAVDVTAMGGCGMMVHGTWMGGYPTGPTCSSQPYMDTLGEELERHAGVMAEWMRQQDAGGLWEEMEAHLGLMRFHIGQMASHMRQTYGSHMGGGGTGMM